MGKVIGLKNVHKYKFVTLSIMIEKLSAIVELFRQLRIVEKKKREKVHYMVPETK